MFGRKGGSPMRKEPTLVFGHDQMVAEWVGERIPHVGKHGFKDYVAVAALDPDRNKVLAGFVYHDYHKSTGTIQGSMAAESPLWATRGTIRAILHIPFMQYGCYKVWMGVPIANERVIKTCLHVGLKKEATLAHHFGEAKHAVILRMLRPDYLRIFRHEL
jgi:hypothetical protein